MFVLMLSLFLVGTPILAILDVFSLQAAVIIGTVLFFSLVFLAVAGAAAPIAEEVLEKAAKRPPQTSGFENDLAPRFVSFFSHATTPDLRPPKTSASRITPPPEVEVTMVTK